MILKSLVDYYHRRLEDKTNPPPRYGFAKGKLSFVLVLDEAGKLVSVEDRRETRNGKKITGVALLPQSVKRTLRIKPNSLWDNAEYILGIKSKPKNTEKDRKSTEKKCKVFSENVDKLLGIKRNECCS